MIVPIEKRSSSYRKILALLIEEGPKTKTEIATALNISETTIRECLGHAQRDCRVHACDWRVPDRGYPAKLYKFGQGETPPKPRHRSPTNAKRGEDELALERSRKLAESTLNKVRENASQGFNPFASLMVQVA